MIDLSSINNIYLFAGAADFRKGIVGLSGLILVSYPNITDRLDNLFIFCNSTRNQIKILHFDETGIWLYQKRLNKGKFIYPDSKGDYLITKENLITILQGLNFIQKIEGKTNQDYALFWDKIYLFFYYF